MVDVVTEKNDVVSDLYLKKYRLSWTYKHWADIENASNIYFISENERRKYIRIFANYYKPFFYHMDEFDKCQELSEFFFDIIQEKRNITDKLIAANDEFENNIAMLLGMMKIDALKFDNKINDIKNRKDSSDNYE